MPLVRPRLPLPPKNLAEKQKKEDDVDEAEAADQVAERPAVQQERVTLKNMAKNLKLWVFLVANSKSFSLASRFDFADPPRQSAKLSATSSRFSTCRRMRQYVVPQSLIAPAAHDCFSQSLGLSGSEGSALLACVNGTLTSTGSTVSANLTRSSRRGMCLVPRWNGHPVGQALAASPGTRNDARIVCRRPRALGGGRYVRLVAG